MGTVKSNILLLTYSKSNMMIAKIIVSFLSLGLSLQAYTEDAEDSPHYLVEDTSANCDYNYVYQTRRLYQYLWGRFVYRTGPFAANPNYGTYFNDGYAARKYSDPRTFKSIVQTIAFKGTDDVCAAIQTNYDGTTTLHPMFSGTGETPKDWVGQQIRSIRGCANNRINRLSYSVSIGGEGAYDCGTSTKGQAFNGYPFQFDRNRCTFVYWSGRTVKFTDGTDALTDIYLLAMLNILQFCTTHKGSIFPDI